MPKRFYSSGELARKFNIGRWTARRVLKAINAGQAGDMYVLDKNDLGRFREELKRRAERDNRNRKWEEIEDAQM